MAWEPGRETYEPNAGRFEAGRLGAPPTTLDGRERERVRELEAGEGPRRFERFEGERGRRVERERFATTPSSWDLRHEPTGALVRDFIGEAQSLVREEVRLAKAEFRDEAKDMGKAAGSIGAGGAVLYAGFLALVGAVVGLLSLAMHPWVASLIVGLVVMAVGALMVLGGQAKLKRASFKPEQTSETLKEDKEWARGMMRGVRSNRRVHA